MRLLQTLTFLCLFLSLGCRLGPDYQRPTIDTGAQFRGAQTQAADNASLADLPWWKLFGDAQLQEYIRTALENNKNLMIAVARVDEARAAVGGTRSGLFPQLWATADPSRTRLSNDPEKLDLHTNLYQAGLGLSYEVDLWGRLRRATEAARADLLATEHARHTVVSTLVSDVAQNYLRLRELDLELSIAERTLHGRMESERLTRLRKEYGRANGLELERAVGETASTEATLATIKNDIEQTENALSILLGENPGEIARGTALVDQPIPPEIPSGLPASLLERRPDVLQAEAQLIAANARIGEAKAMFFPRISLTGLLGFESDELDAWFTHNAYTWNVAGNLAQPIFTGGSLFFNYRAVKARREQALTAYLGSIQQALREVADALAARKYSLQEREKRQKQVDALVHASKLANERYLGGRSNYLEVLDVEREQFSAELQLAQVRLSEQLSIVYLYRALGGGWQQEEEKPVQPANEEPKSGN